MNELDLAALTWIYLKKCWVIEAAKWSPQYDTTCISKIKTNLNSNKYCLLCTYIQCILYIYKNMDMNDAQQFQKSVCLWGGGKGGEWGQERVEKGSQLKK